MYGYTMLNINRSHFQASHLVSSQVGDIYLIGVIALLCFIIILAIIISCSASETTTGAKFVQEPAFREKHPERRTRYWDFVWFRLVSGKVLFFDQDNSTGNMVVETLGIRGDTGETHMIHGVLYRGVVANYRRTPGLPEDQLARVYKTNLIWLASTPVTTQRTPLLPHSTRSLIIRRFD